jgi:lysophospholipase L1-like esterase
MEEHQSGDHLHPNDGGYRMLANAVGLGLFKAPARGTATASR